MSISNRSGDAQAGVHQNNHGQWGPATRVFLRGLPRGFKQRATSLTVSSSPVKKSNLTRLCCEAGSAACVLASQSGQSDRFSSEHLKEAGALPHESQRRVLSCRRDSALAS